MKFECDNCHAKYKISDDKVAGRVVRFPCRRCDHRILIDGRRDDVTVPAGNAYGFDDITRRSEPAPFGAEPATARRRPVTYSRRRQSSVPPRRRGSVARRMTSSPAAASSALVGQHPGLAPPLPANGLDRVGTVGAPHVDKAEWHVSINDVPVGPVRLEELAHKVDAGAVSEYSLVWRDGFAEWRPLATVPELMSLLYERRSSGPPTRSRFSSIPPFVEAQTAIKETGDPPSIPPGAPKPPVHPIGVTAGAAGELDFGSLSQSFSNEPSVPSIPAMFSEIPEAHVPLVHAPAPMREPDAPASGAFSGFPQVREDSVSVPAIPPQVPAEAPRTSTPAWVMILLVGVAVFAGVAATIVVDRWGDSLMERLLAEEAQPMTRPRRVATPVEVEPPAEEIQAASEQEAETSSELESSSEETADAANAEPSDEDVNDDTVQDEAADTEPVAPEQASAAPAMRPAKPRRRARVKRAPKPVAAPPSPGIKRLDGDSLSTDEQKLLADFGSKSTAGVAKIDVSEAKSTTSQRDPLDSKAVSSTVSANKPRLQRCYERAIRGQRSPDAVRMNVSIVVAASGRVSKVDVAGSGPGGLAECMEASIRRWRFPVSSEGGPAQFPVVFSAN